MAFPKGRSRILKRQHWISQSAALAVAIAVLGVPAVATGAAAATPGHSSSPATPAAGHDPAQSEPHDLPGPFSKQQAAEHSAALQQVVSGDATVQQRDGSQVVQLGHGKGKQSKYVELGREKTDKIFTILVDFGDQVDDTTTYDPDGPDGPEPPTTKYGGDPGPAHNTIAQPDRSQDNSTAWQADYNQQHFQDLYFSHDKDKESLAKYYEKQSSGRYSVDGEVTDWVKVPYNEARYGSDWCGSTICSNAWDLIRDATTAYVADQKAQGRTDAQIKADLAAYDQWDRYDYDGDGNFNEPDGYIDHFQIVHAGEDQSAGGGVQGTDALWAHRWYAYGSDAGKSGPTGNKAGGTEIGDTGIWVGDYTLQPENGGLGVFAHEYGHDLGLPDEYDTSYVGENNTAFWTLMSSGSWMGTGKDAIGDLPDDMSAWDKLQLGWLNYGTAKAATRSTTKLGVAEYNTKDKQALVVQLPDKSVTTTITTPAEGDKQWWSGMGDDLSNTLTRTVDLTGASSASLGLKGWWDIEQNYDFLYTEVSTDGGANWTALDGTANGKAVPRDGSDRPALTGTSGAYEDLSFPLDAYAGKQIQLRFRYATDGGVAQQGFAADAITVTADGKTLLTDGAETDDNGWSADGFSRIGASFSKDYPEYYVAENRQYTSYDTTLKTGPYNFGWTSTRPDWVEHYPYQTGLLVWLWDTSQPDNNVGAHPGSGEILPVDAHAKPETFTDGTVIRNRVQAYDSAFSWYPSAGFTLHNDGVAKRIPAKLGSPAFDDHYGTYWYANNPYGSVKVPDTNTRLTILSQALDGSTMTVQVSPSHR
ncbi:immune inhibitor A [Streptomyces sp. NBC_00669]|uniref:immune inhibitor A domain-containing protein n=1 Tax=unclassified Streptomyces TaxID=2593676 RepID=UPI002E375E6A|nr:immune inhibitor A domain-containing protein [Streptomyces sp. NBC_00669]